jgi:pyridoxine 5-phosphate synthase
VPDELNQLTSNHGWDTIKEKSFLTEIIAVFKANNIRVSIFVDPSEMMITHAKETGTDRIELYTESYASHYEKNKEQALSPYVNAASVAHKLGLGINAGHDLDLHNLAYFAKHVHHLQEVSIGHAVVCDALYLGLENTIQLYKRCLA